MLIWHPELLLYIGPNKFIKQQLGIQWKGEKKYVILKVGCEYTSRSPSFGDKNLRKKSI